MSDNTILSDANLPLFLTYISRLASDNIPLSDSGARVSCLPGSFLRAPPDKDTVRRTAAPLSFSGAPPLIAEPSGIQQCGLSRRLSCVCDDVDPGVVAHVRQPEAGLAAASFRISATRLDRRLGRSVFCRRRGPWHRRQKTRDDRHTPDGINATRQILKYNPGA